MPKGTRKERSHIIAYNNKVRRITNWYNHLLKERKKEPNKINPTTKQPVKRKELKPLNFYLGKLRKPKEQND